MTKRSADEWRGDPQFTGERLKRLVLDIEAAVGKNGAGITPLGCAVTQLAEAAWKADTHGEEAQK